MNDSGGTLAQRWDQRRVARLTRRLSGFAAAHGGAAEGHISYLGTRGYRLELVGADGVWGDAVEPSRETLSRAAEGAGIPLRESFDAELAGRLRTGPYEWRRMAGSQLGGGRAAG